MKKQHFTLTCTYYHSHYLLLHTHEHAGLTPDFPEQSKVQFTQRC